MDQDVIQPEAGRQLLEAARATVEAAVRNKPLPPSIVAATPPFDQFRGMFVSLHVDGQLRGCMGTFHPDLPLGQLVQQIALTSLHDPRFGGNRIQPAELDRLTIEVSVLSPMRRSVDPLAELEPGVHGVLVRAGNRGGCFLPQVATEMGWTGQEMLDFCCSHKAGLPSSAWKAPGAEVYLFTAQILTESHAQ